MGESTFSLWCGQAGLTANGSHLDRTGWDFFVEFPFAASTNPTQLHDPAIECKIQVKATDKTDRKLPIKLSNLRRLITAPMPAFIIFIEFDGMTVAQRAFLVHIDESLISKTLKRIHELEHVDGVFDHNKRSLTIHYGPEHEISSVTGASLKRKIEEYVPSGMSVYVAKKSRHLASTGFENGFAQITINTKGKENLIDLIDVSLGLKQSVRISKFEGFHTRFGIKSKSPMFDAGDGKLEMSELKPTATGIIRFREDRLSAGLAFPCKFYSSPLNAIVPPELVKFRIEADGFDVSMNPFTGAAEYRINAGAGMRFAINRLRDVIRLMHIITSSAKKILVDLTLDGMNALDLSLIAQDKPFEYYKILKALDAATKICAYFELNEPIKVSLEEVADYADSIIQFYSVIESDPSLFRCDFSVQGDGYDVTKPTACILLTTTKIGRRVFGFIFVITGSAHTLEDGRYSLLADNAIIERKIISDDKGVIQRKDLVQAFDAVGKTYDDFEVVTMFDKTDDDFRG